jgi:hypothetical protein
MMRGNIMRFAAGRFEKFDILRRQRCTCAELVDERVRHIPLFTGAKVKPEIGADRRLPNGRRCGLAGARTERGPPDLT